MERMAHYIDWSTRVYLSLIHIYYHENRIIDQKYILQWEKISELGF